MQRKCTSSRLPLDRGILVPGVADDNPAMTEIHPTQMQDHPGSAQVVVACGDLQAAIAYCVDELGFRIDMIMPADAPRVAVVSGRGTTLRLVADAQASGTHAPVRLRIPTCAAPAPAGHDESATGLRVESVEETAVLRGARQERGFSICRADADDAWAVGRAGMHYRDLVPGRFGGRLIASQIRIPAGGVVPDHVHYHKVGFQMIFCRSGWVRVVYEDQGPPFVMRPGDCVLQPPTIRHRVLEASPGLEVIEIGCPAEHETWHDHDLRLPTAQQRPRRLFGGQRFVHEVAAGATWHVAADPRVDFRDTGIAAATRDLARVRVARMQGSRSDSAGSDAPNLLSGMDPDRTLFLVLLDGRARLRGPTADTHLLESGDACVIPRGADRVLDALVRSEVLAVSLQEPSA